MIKNNPKIYDLFLILMNYKNLKKDLEKLTEDKAPIKILSLVNQNNNLKTIQKTLKTLNLSNDLNSKMMMISKKKSNKNKVKLSVKN